MKKEVSICREISQIAELILHASESKMYYSMLKVSSRKAALDIEGQPLHLISNRIGAFQLIYFIKNCVTVTE